MHRYRMMCLLLAAWFGIGLLHAADEARDQRVKREDEEAKQEQERWEALDPELRKVLEKMDCASKKVKDLKASVLYKRSIPLLEEEEESRGSLIFKKPNLIVLKLGEPRNEDAYTDGKQWWLVSHDDKEVQIYEAARSTDVCQEAAFLNFGYGRPSRQLLKGYEISLAKKTKVTRPVLDDKEGENKKKQFTEYSLKFSPRKGEAPARYSSVETRVCDDTWLPQHIVLKEGRDEFIHEFHLQALKVNTGIKKKEFRCKPPRGYKVWKPAEF